MKIAHVSCIFSIKYAVFNECKDQYSNKAESVIFVQQFYFLSEKNFQSVGQLSGNISEDFVKTVFEFLLQKVFLSQEITTGHAQKSHDLS